MTSFPSHARHHSHKPTASTASADALKGASLAFGSKQNKQPDALRSWTRDGRVGSHAARIGGELRDGHDYDGAALVAATSTARNARSRSQSRVSTADDHTAGRDHGKKGHSMGYLAAQTTGTMSSEALQPSRVLKPGQTANLDSKSPSLIAATLAASRSASPSPNIKATHRPGYRSDEWGSYSGSTPAVDSTSVAPTNSLIKMFEGAGSHAERRIGSQTRKPTTTPILPRSESEDSMGNSTATEDLPALPPPRMAVPYRRELYEVNTRAPPSLPTARTWHSSDDDDSGDEDYTMTLSRASTIKAKPRPPKSPQLPQPSIQDIVNEAVRGVKASSLPSSNERAVSTGKNTSTEVKAADPPAVKPKPSVKQLSTQTAETKPRQRPAPPESVSYAHFPGPRVRATSPPSSEAQKRDPVVQATHEIRAKKPQPIFPPSVIVKSSGPPEILSPKPTRPVKPTSEAATVPAMRFSAPAQQSSPSPEPLKSSPRRAIKKPPTPPKPRSSRMVSSASPQRTRPQSATLRKVPQRTDTLSSNDTFVSASSSPPPMNTAHSPPLPGRRQSLTSAPASPSRTPRLRPHNASTSTLPLDHLTNAIMAGSLAASRLTPQHTGSSVALSLPPSLPPRQKSPRPMMKTLRSYRQDETEDEQADRHKRSHLRRLKKGKHSHHEGSRKKWREEITPRERKRYEALWQSNRGYLLSTPSTPSPATQSSPGTSAEDKPAATTTSEYVANVVVREIWKRSRLPTDELAEVWDLVDRQGKGVLHRVEFVVGLWLIDQRLKGRKIPHKVGASVWASASGMKVAKVTK